MKSLEEKELLVKWAKMLGEEVDPKIVESIKAEKAAKRNLEFFQKKLEEEKTKGISEKPIIIDDNLLKEQEIPNQLHKLVETNIIENQEFKKAPNPENDDYNKKIEELYSRLQYIDRKIKSIVLGGGGSGETNLLNLDDFERGSIGEGKVLRYSAFNYPKTFYLGYENTVEVTESEYEMVPGDYYVGVNRDNKTTITLPSSPENGLQVVIKDELGKASHAHKYIDILPGFGDSIDGKNSARIAIDYGSITFIYRNGWRII